MFDHLFKDRDVIEPKDLEKYLSKTKQWQERNAILPDGTPKLKCFRAGKKVFYTRQHLQSYFETLPENAQSSDGEGLPKAA